MQFIIIFLQDVLTGEPDLVKCAKKAYEGSLKKFHGWMVQGIFSVSSTSVQTFTIFDISSQPHDIADHSKTQFIGSLVSWALPITLFPPTPPL